MAQNKSTQDTGVTTDVVRWTTEFETQELARIESFDDAMNLLVSTFGVDEAVVTADKLGDGFAVIKNKDQLCEVPFVLLKWEQHKGDNGDYTVARGMTRQGMKFVLVDGGTGIHSQLVEFSALTGRDAGLLCRNGLRRSDYDYTDDQGETRPASTYYIDTSAPA